MWEAHRILFRNQGTRLSEVSGARAAMHLVYILGAKGGHPLNYLREQIAGHTNTVVEYSRDRNRYSNPHLETRLYRALIAAVGALPFDFVASGTPAMAATTDAALLPSLLTIHIKDFKFNPTPAKIHSGDRVTFVKDDDDEAHTATSDDKSFDSEGVDEGGTVKVVLSVGARLADGSLL